MSMDYKYVRDVKCFLEFKDIYLLLIINNALCIVTTRRFM